MPADVETMFSVRVKPWHGIGTVVEESSAMGNSLPHMRWRRAIQCSLSVMKTEKRY